jgi:hypothetical protein
MIILTIIYFLILDGHFDPSRRYFARKKTYVGCSLFFKLVQVQLNLRVQKKLRSSTNGLNYELFKKKVKFSSIFNLLLSPRAQNSKKKFSIFHDFLVKQHEKTLKS